MCLISMEGDTEASQRSAEQKYTSYIHTVGRMKQLSGYYSTKVLFKNAFILRYNISTTEHFD